MSGTPAAQALARLAGAEASAAAQHEALTTLARQVDKLQTRTRIVSRDVRTALKALEAGAGQQGAVLQGAALRLDKVEQDVQDVEALVAAMQQVSAKQFTLLTQVITSQAQQQGRGKKTNSANASQAKPAVVVEDGNKAIASRPQGAGEGLVWSRKKEATGVNGGVASGGVDEWGRQRRVQTPATEVAKVEEQPSEPADSAVEGGGTGNEGRLGRSVKLKLTGGTPPEGGWEAGTLGEGVDMKVNDDGSVSFSFDV